VIGLHAIGSVSSIDPRFLEAACRLRHYGNNHRNTHFRLTESTRHPVEFRRPGDLIWNRWGLEAIDDWLTVGPAPTQEQLDETAARFVR
jgi:hypothetical protein